MPLALLVAAALAGAAPPPASATLCAVGRAALADLPAVNGTAGQDRYYAGADLDPNGLLARCPALAAALPPGYPLADRDAWSRANLHVPILGRTSWPAFVYALEVPRLDADGRHATVRFTCTCSGLCGSASEARYVRVGREWHRDGAVRLLFVS